MMIHFWMVFGIILTMQIPCRLHVIEAPNAFSKIRFLKELPVCSTIRGKDVAEFAFSFQLRILSSFPCLREPAEQANTPLYVPAMARGLPKPLKEKSLKYIFEALSVHLFRLMNIKYSQSNTMDMQIILFLSLF